MRSMLEQAAVILGDVMPRAEMRPATSFGFHFLFCFINILKQPCLALVRPGADIPVSLLTPCVCDDT